MNPKDQALEVWGELACFTRPEMKVERFSYPIITPSAARGIYDAIYCKPNRDHTQAQFHWQITKVEVLKEPRYIALRRNEVKEKGPSDRTVLRWMSGKQEPEPIWADGAEGGEKGRTQRQTMALKNVRYRLHAQVRPWPRMEGRLQSFEAQFRRRAAQGKCIYQPYFGCREFPAYFELMEPDGPPAQPVAWDQDLGLMLYDVFDLSRPGTPEDEPRISLFEAQVRGGVLEVPPYASERVFKVDGGETRC
jgi:CRISPR-associated protein Cas5d